MLISTLDLDELLNFILQKALEGVNADRGTVYLVDHENEILWSKALTGNELFSIRLAIGEGIAGQVAKTGETFNIKDAKQDERFFENIDTDTGYTTESVLCMPLKNKNGKLLGVFQLLNKKKGVFTSEDEKFIEAFSTFASAAIENARLYEQEKEKISIEKEMIAAGEVQKALFPSEIPDIPGYSIAAINIPAKNTSGDLYDFVELDDGNLIFALGDVSGKGLPASIIMANLQSMLHAFPYFNRSTSYCSNQLNRIIEKFSTSTKFVTLFFGLLNPENHTITYTNAGHEYPILLRSNSGERLSTGGLPLGLFADTEYEESKTKMNPGDLLLIFSDGVTDATDKKDETFTEERLKKLVTANHHLQPNDLLQLICDEVQKFVGNAPQFDDITLIIIKRENS